MSRRLLPQIVVLGVLAIALSVASANAARQSAVHARATSETVSTAQAVRKAFSSVKINLAGRTAGDTTQRVTVLSAVVPKKITLTKPWTVQIFVYRTSTLATQAFNAGVAQWRDNGIAATRANNIIVTVVPKGQFIGIHGAPFAMPLLVRTALNTLSHHSA